MNRIQQSEMFAARRAHAERQTQAQKRHRLDPAAALDRAAVNAPRPRMRTLTLPFALIDAAIKGGHPLAESILSAARRLETERA